MTIAPRLLAWVVAVVTVVASPVHAQSRADSIAIQAILRASASGSQLDSNLRYLTDVIGPRLTGSSALRVANQWAAQRFVKAGLPRPWHERWRFARAWERGPLSVTLLTPHRRELGGASWAWAPGTNGPVTGDVVLVNAHDERDFASRFHGKLGGKWVITREPYPVRLADVPQTPADSIAEDSLRRVFYRLSPDEQRFRTTLTATLAAEGIAGIFGDAAKPNALLLTSGSPHFAAPMPYVVLPHESYAQLYRLLVAGEKASVRVNVENTLTKDTVDAYNTLAELRGTDRANEVVIVGAHLDSWDLGTGMSDDGAGVVAVIEAARILRASGVRPRRSIRFALFTGEEQGILGSSAYVAAHADELPRVQAMLVLDTGSGRISGMSLEGLESYADLWRELFAPISALGPFEVQLRHKGGTDNLPFIRAGVPGFFFDQIGRGYDLTYHSQIDTYDHAVIPDLQQAATVMALTALQLANRPELLPRVVR